MIFIKTKYYPFKGFKAISHYPFVLHTKELSNIDKNHEEIHGAQQKELYSISLSILCTLSFVFSIEFIFAYVIIAYLLFLLLSFLSKVFIFIPVLLSFGLNFWFYITYLIEFGFKGYRNTSFEKEAYENEIDFSYLDKRMFFSWIKYI